MDTKNSLTKFLQMGDYGNIVLFEQFCQEIVKQVGEDLFIQVKGNTFDMDDEWWEKYPGY